MPLEFTVTSDSDGHRLDQFLVSVLGGHSRSQIQKLIAAGHVTVARRDARANLTMHEGDRVSVEVPPVEPASVTSEPLPLEILYQDRDIAVATHDPGVVAVLRPAAKGFTAVELDRKPEIVVHEIEIGDLDRDGKREVYATPSEPNRPIPARFATRSSW